MSVGQRERVRKLAQLRGEGLWATAVYLMRTAFRLVPTNLIDPAHFADLKIAETGLDGPLAFVRLENGRLFYSYPSSAARVRQYWMIRDKVPPVIKADTFGAVVDVVYRFMGLGSPDNDFLPGEGGVIIEAGAFIGLKALRYAERVGPSGRVIAVEIDRFNYETMCRNVAASGLQDVVTCVHAGIWNAEGRAQAGNRGYQTHSLVDLDGSRSDALGQVETVSVSGLIDRFGLDRVDYLNLQVNGAEIEALDGCLRHVDRITAYNVATGYARDGQPLQPQVLAWFAARGIEASPHPDWPDLIVARRCGAEQRPAGGRS